MPVAAPVTTTPHFHRLSFPLGWLNRCEHFFCDQHTLECDKVWLDSFHLTGVTQQRFYMLEQNKGVVVWPCFKELCQQRYGTPLRSNH